MAIRKIGSLEEVSGFSPTPDRRPSNPVATKHLKEVLARSSRRALLATCLALSGVATYTAVDFSDAAENVEKIHEAGNLSTADAEFASRLRNEVGPGTVAEIELLSSVKNEAERAQYIAKQEKETTMAFSGFEKCPGMSVNR